MATKYDDYIVKIIYKYISINIDSFIGKTIDINSDFIVNLTLKLNSEKYNDCIYNEDGIFFFFLYEIIQKNNIRINESIVKKGDYKNLLHKQFTIIDEKEKIMDIINKKTNTIVWKKIDQYDPLYLTDSSVYRVNTNQNQNYNLFFDNSGTGTGKTFNIVGEFIYEIIDHPNLGIHSLIFTAPQKNQLDIDDSLYNRAYNENIPVLYFRSHDDLQIESIALPAFIGHKRFNNEQFFDEISKLLNLSNIKDALHDDFNDASVVFLKKSKEKEEGEEEENNSKKYSFFSLSKIISDYKNAQSRITYNVDMDEDLKKIELKNIKKSFQVSITNLATFLTIRLFYNEYKANHYKEKSKTDICKILNNKNKTIQHMVSFISFVLPLEIIKYKTSILYLTLDKALTRTSIIDIRDDLLRNTHGKLFDILSGKDDYKENIDKELLQKNHSDNYELQLENIEKFTKNKEHNYYADNGIYFNFFFDEEHKSYPKIEDKMTSSLIGEDNDKASIMDSLATLSRWIQNIYNEDNLEYREYIKTTRDKNHLIDKRGFPKETLKNRLKTMTAFEFKVSQEFFKLCKKYLSWTENDIKDITKIFVGASSKGLLVSKSNKNSILSIVDNIILTSKNDITNMDVLRNIYIELGDKNNARPISSYIIKYNKEDGKRYISFYEFIILIINMYVAFTSIYDVNGDITQILTKTYGDDRNNNDKNKRYQDINAKYLYRKAKENKEYLDGILNDCYEEEILVNTFFTYFMKKMKFSLKNHLIDNTKEKIIDSISIDNIDYERLFIGIDISLYPPEMIILRLLTQKTGKNTVTLASATRGFPGMYCGNFNVNFFKKINDIYNHNNKKNIINYKTISGPNVADLTSRRFKRLESVSVKKISSSYKESSKIFDYNVDTYTVDDNDDSIIKNHLMNVEKTNDKIFIDIKDTKGLDVFIKSINTYKDKNNINGGYRSGRVYNKLIVSLSDAIKNRKNALCLGLWNTMSSFLKKYSECFDSLYIIHYNKQNKQFESSHNEKVEDYGKYPNHIQDFIEQVSNLDDANKTNVILLFPYGLDVDYSIKIIGFEGGLGNDDYFKEVMTTIKDKQNILLASSYVSAGTGLNIVIRDYEKNDNICSYYEKDFDNIYIVSAPYWSAIQQPTGLIHNSNYNTVFRNVTDNNEKYLSDLDIGINNGEYKTILMNEHYMEIVKDIIQACGRIERRNYKQDRSIIFVSDERLYPKHKDDSFLTVMEYFKIFSSLQDIEPDKYKELSYGFSVNTRTILAVSNFYMNDRVFSKEETERVDSIYNNLLTSTNDFIGNQYMKKCKFREWMEKCRNGDKKYNFFPILNDVIRETLRPIDLYNMSERFEKSINKNIQNGINIQFGVSKETIMDMLNNLVLKIDEDGCNLEFLKHKSLAFDKENKLTTVGINRTLITEDSLYSFDKNISSSKLTNDTDIIGKKIFEKIFNFDKNLSTDSNSYIPVGDMPIILMGNRSEYIFSEYLKMFMSHFNIDNNRYKMYKDYIDYETQCILCEKFDIGIVDTFDNKILCIDVKGVNFRKDEDTKKTIGGKYIKEKIESVKNTLSKYSVEYIYINTQKVIDDNLIHRNLCEHAKYFSMFNIVTNDEGNQPKFLGIDIELNNKLLDFFNKKENNQLDYETFISIFNGEDKENDK